MEEEEEPAQEPPDDSFNPAEQLKFSLLLSSEQKVGVDPICGNWSVDPDAVLWLVSSAAISAHWVEIRGLSKSAIAKSMHRFFLKSDREKLY